MAIRVMAIIATYNEERFVGPCIEHYRDQGVDVFILDNESTDGTVDIVRSYLGEGVVGLETFERNGQFSLTEQLRQKERVVAQSAADWYIHADADEIRLAPNSSQTLAEALADVDAQGYSLVNFLEFTFVPTIEHPDHDHADYRDTMLSYYYFAPRYPHHLKAWKGAAFPDLDLASAGGHRLIHEPEQLCPVDFKFRHYLCLSLDHLRQKWIEKTFDPDELAQGWHGYRATMTNDQVVLPSRHDLLRFTTDDELDASHPVTTEHLVYRPQ